MKSAFLSVFKNSRGSLPIIIPIILVVLVAAVGGGYLLMNSVNKPSQIKAQVQPINSTLDNYIQSVNAISDDLKATSTSSDADALQRALEKAKGLLKTANDDLSTLNPQVNNLNFTETAQYRKDLDQYISESKKLIQIEQDNVEPAEQLIPVVRSYQKDATDLAGVANYMYSNPDKYVQQVNDFTTKDDQYIKTIEGIKVTGQAKESVDVLLKQMKAENTFIKSMAQAVKNRDSNAIVAAQKQYAQDAQSLQQENSRVDDSHKEVINTTSQNLQTLASKLKTDYTELQVKYKF